ncbi:hypothetical protein CMQ_7120 [Grosmannia clavigera kw1407]|uniref:Uncharacterized protein n=1 Tax=Grosmannia clavigera (strain kw1407 / UAMH 11150) TaxID=655863 RepID=F0XPC1_GROCL|nr:uncharacterized protein CMQ_7120 [Grosmannia clavigera kw1407]EFX00118.1 hypothetical protein CMQ_7120 [Grosmannia clavigera kw1407]
MSRLQLTWEAFQVWAAARPSLCFQIDGTHDDNGNWLSCSGGVFALPIRKPFWLKLIVGDLKECDIDVSMFPRIADGEDEKDYTIIGPELVGFHFVQLEKSLAVCGRAVEPDDIPFCNKALDRLWPILKDLHWRISGCSGD